MMYREFNKEEKNHMDRDNSVVNAGERWSGGGGRGYGGINDDERKCDFGW